MDLYEKINLHKLISTEYRDKFFAICANRKCTECPLKSCCADNRIAPIDVIEAYESLIEKDLSVTEIDILNCLGE